MADQLISTTWAAKACGVAYMTVRNAIAKGELYPAAYYLDGRGKARPLFRRADLDSWLEGRQPPPA
jgi:hypothetical protein